ncbi:uncharacterized protein PGTG_14381 [Puccinia graminis f. sp. tritici CRL 75-36-700-3]|uniref:DDE Tnp4 domain-containing protein n=1 Tax=Puccinia graminis f. sp. tritici (strain CRL 75-36-700-3 / race SCCL) TaxID=418459 RepID=E3KVT1_PUCGT|nr:uncharacterized protein PGTG_14381 [Puccinia graminis f. sp. tritici CRL 75-36-700-3]EFP88297.2 hypothetical protein PGTG_14381 [Puccinia graminis f. sp. tritici CRL 75-36-700-3]
MVRTSRRRLLITSLEKSIKDDLTLMALNYLFGGDENDTSGSDMDTDYEDDKWEDEEMIYTDLECKARALLKIQGDRYLAPRGRIEKAPEMHQFILHRMQEIFHNNSNHPQRPVIEQMMVALNRLGCFGNGVAVGMIATCYRIGHGTVEVYTNRCIMAILSLKTTLLEWPTAAARQETKAHYGEVGFKGCVGLIDGSLVVLSTCPEKDGQDYYSRKGFYCIATLLVCDQHKNITYVFTGWPGCSHDMRLMTNCALSKSPNQYFSDGEYLLADSAFVPTLTTVPAYKRKRNKQLTDEQTDFNRHLSGVRVAIENCIGLLKN